MLLAVASVLLLTHADIASATASAAAADDDDDVPVSLSNVCACALNVLKRARASSGKAQSESAQRVHRIGTKGAHAGTKEDARENACNTNEPEKVEREHDELRRRAKTETREGKQRL
jgi:hypothetical protein